MRRSCWRVRGTRTRRHDPRGVRACGAAREGQQRDIARALDGHTQPALMTRTYARHAPGQNLAALLHELRQNVGAFVVDKVDLLDAELADFLLAKILALPARTPARTSRSARATAWTALAPPATGATFTPRRSAWRWCLFLFLC